MSNENWIIDAPLAMSYVPWQPWGELYDEKVALERGTAFPALDLPFCGGGRRDERM